jgi:hypothetical protein
MPTDPRQFATTPEGIQAERHADFERRLRALEGGNTGARSAFSGATGFSTITRDVVQEPSWAPKTDLYIPDASGVVVEVMADSIVNANFGGTVYVVLRLKDGLVTKQWTLIQRTFPNPSPGSLWIFAAPGGVGTEISGSWIVLPRELLKSVGLSLDRVVTFQIGYILSGGDQGEWYETRLWTRIR